MERLKLTTGFKYEKAASYSGAIRVGNLVEVAGTVAVDENGDIVGPGDVVAQMEFIITKIDKVLTEAGSSLKDVIRTRMFVRDMSKHGEGVAKAHGEIFKDIRPVSTLVEAKLFLPEYLIEIEVTAWIS